MAKQLERPIAAERHLKMSYEEFLSEFDEDSHAEWVDGEVIVFMPPKIRHARVVTFFFGLLLTYVRLTRRGEVLTAPFEMRLESIPSSREPDIAFIAEEHAPRVTADRVAGAADLVVEVVSEDSVTRDRRDKLREYAEAGVAEYWVVEGREGLSGTKLWILHNEGYYEEQVPDSDVLLRSRVLDGFWFDQSWLTRDLLPDPLLLALKIVPDALRRLSDAVD